MHCGGTPRLMTAAALAAAAASSVRGAAALALVRGPSSSAAMASSRRAYLHSSLCRPRAFLGRAMSATDTEAEPSAATGESIIGTVQGGRMSRSAVPSSPDARTVSDHLPLILSHLEARRASEETLDAARRIASLNDDRVALIQRRDKALSVRKEQSAAVGKYMRDGGEEKHGEALAEAKKLSAEAAEEAAAAEEELEQIGGTVSALLAGLPNLLDDRVVDGDDDSQNEEVSRWGDTSALPAELGWADDFEPKWHDDVAGGLSGWKAEEAVGMSGARFVALSGQVARLERAISTFFLDMHANNGYTEVSPPLVVSRSALEGTSQLPKFEEDLFKITPDSHTCNGEDAFLIPTAEVPLTNLHANSILEENQLPMSYVALTPCFRAEAGSYGRDTRGLIRTHQFQKVELVKISTPETSDEQHHLLTRHAEECLEALRLPYRKVRLCSGDVGFSAQLCYDLEVWLPSTGEYREISSCSNTGDFQARRMALRYRPNPAPEGGEDGASGNKKGGKKKKAKKPKPVLCHTINGSGLAIGRTLLAVLENYQQPDGSVVVPEVLRPYMGGLEVLKPKEA